MASFSVQCLPSKKVILYATGQQISDTMKSLCIIACVVVAVVAQEYTPEEYQQMLEYRYPVWYSEPHDRPRRQLSVDKQTGDVTLAGKVGDNGKAFGTLGSRGESLFGKAGYQHTLNNDNRGKLDATAYGTRVLSPYGNSDHLGGRLDWKNDRAFSSVGVSHQMHGPNTFDAAAGARWPIGKNGDVSVGGTYTRTGPFQDYGVRAGLKYRF